MDSSSIASWFSKWNDKWTVYVAAALRDGKYEDIASIPRVEPPTPSQRLEIAKLTTQLLSQNRRGVNSFVVRRGRRERRTLHGTEDSIRSLERFTRPLKEQSNVDSTDEAKKLLEPLRGRAERLDSNDMSGLPPDAGEVDRLVLVVARWFKHEYFRWVDPIKCPLCGEDTRGSAVAPTEEERRDGAGRCELHTCVKCGGSDRFPRYTEVKALMRSRRGRCGEYAQLFYIFLLALGVETRYVWNSEDHVWTEYWSPELQHWVHVDSCEAEVNKPLLYDRGWGKKQAFVLAFGRCGAEDVTRVYVDDLEANAAFRRQKRMGGSGIDESRLGTLLLECTVRCRALLDEEERLCLLSMDEAQARWMADDKGRSAEAERVNLHGRDSGTKEWKEARGEAGEGENARGETGEGENATTTVGEEDVVITKPTL